MKFNEEFKKEILNEVKKELIKELKEELLKDIFKKETNDDDYKVEDLLFNQYETANDVLRQMREMIAKYKVVHVSDYYELAGITNNLRDYKYGWYDLGDVKIEERDENYYYLNMPEPKHID